MKRIATLLLLASLIFAGTISLFAHPAADFGRPVETGNVDLVLLHTNDHHGTVLPRGDRGGLAERATFIREVREQNPHVLILDGGDMNTGTALSNMFQGTADFLAYNMMGYDAMTFGNHEFNEGLDRMERQMALADFAMFSSNVRRSDGTFLGNQQYLIKEYNGVRVGIFTISTLRTLIVSNPDRSLSFINEIDAARDVVNILRNRERVDVVIGLVHMGTIKESDIHITSQELAAAVPGIDIIVDGHSHTYMEAPLRVGNTYIVSAHERGGVVGQGTLRIQNRRLVGFDWKPVEIVDFAPDNRVSAMLNPFIQLADLSLREVVGEASATFVFGNRETRFQETAIGNMINDGNVWFFREVFGQQIDFAFHNGGNMRAELPQGPLTRENILTVLPFENNLYIVSMYGRDLIELFNFMATIPQGAGGFPQFSREVRLTLDVPNQRMSNITIGGAPIDPNRIYRFCTNDFLLTGGDGYTVLAERSMDVYNTSLLLSYVVIEYIRSQGGVISPVVDGRMNVIGGATPF